MNFGGRIKAEREARNWGQGELATRAGLPQKNGQQTVQAIEERDSKRTMHAPALATALGLNLEWALTGVGEKYADTDDRPKGRKSSQGGTAIGAPSQDNDFVLIEETNVEFRGGPGHQIEYEIVEGGESAAYRRSWFAKEGINPERVIRCKHLGESNEPFLYSGDIALVHLDETEIRNGKVYAFWQEGEGRRIKKLFRDKFGNITIRSFNKDYPDEVLSAEEAAERIRIVGRVRDKSGGGGL